MRLDPGSGVRRGQWYKRDGLGILRQKARSGRGGQMGGAGLHAVLRAAKRFNGTRGQTRFAITTIAKARDLALFRWSLCLGEQQSATIPIPKALPWVNEYAER